MSQTKGLHWQESLVEDGSQHEKRARSCVYTPRWTRLRNCSPQRWHTLHISVFPINQKESGTEGMLQKVQDYTSFSNQYDHPVFPTQVVPVSLDLLGRTRHQKRVPCLMENAQESGVPLNLQAHSLWISSFSKVKSYIIEVSCHLPTYSTVMCINWNTNCKGSSVFEFCNPRNSVNIE